MSEVLDRAREVAKARKSPIRAGAVPVKLMIELAQKSGVSGDPVIRQELARYVSQVRVNGWTMRRSGAAGGKLTGADGSIAKLTTARICQESRDLSYRIVGARGMLAGRVSPLEGDLQTVNLASPGNRLGGGTDEIQLNLLGERALGPAEGAEHRQGRPLPRPEGGDAGRRARLIGDRPPTAVRGNSSASYGPLGMSQRSGTRVPP